MTDFDAFWAAYPRKIGKFAAQRAYAKARTHATADALLAGVARYITTKPTYADWCHATTWLNQGRWLDEADTVPAEASVRDRAVAAAPVGACDELWARVMERLTLKLTRFELEKWLKPVRVERIQNALVLTFTSDYERAWVRRRYATQLREALVELGEPQLLVRAAVSQEMAS